MTHHKKPSFGSIMHSVEGGIKEIESPIVHLEETTVKTVGGIAKGGMGLLKGMEFSIYRRMYNCIYCY